LNPTQFLRRALRYHVRFGQSSYPLAQEVREKFNVNTLTFDQTNWLFNTYLLDWGKMHRVFPRRYRQRIVTRLHQTLPTLLSKYSMLNTVSLTSDSFHNTEQYVKSLYDELCNVSIRDSKRTVRIGPTATAKLLHFIHPNLYVIWDRRWVREPHRYGETSNEYYRYLSDKREVLEHVISESPKMGEEAVEWLTLQHSLDLEQLGLKNTHEPITKLLDEINFGNGRSPILSKKLRTTAMHRALSSHMAR